MQDTSLRKTIGVLIGLGLALLCWVLANVLLLAFAGVLFAVFLRHCAKIVSRHTPIGAALSLVVVVVGILALAVLGGLFLGPSIVEEGQKLITALPSGVSKVEDMLAELSWGKFLLDRTPDEVSFGDWNIMGTLGGTLSSTVGLIANSIVVLFVGLFLASDPGLYRQGVLHLVPKDRRERASEVLDALGNGLWLWLKGQFLDMVIVAVLTGFGLWLIGIPLAMTLGLIAGLTNIIPYVGPFLSAVPAVLIAFTIGFEEAVYTGLVFLVVQQVDGHVLMPIIQKHSTSMPPVLTILAVIGFGVLFGFLGILVATPLLLVLMILVRMLYVEDVLGDHDAKEQEAS